MSLDFGYPSNSHASDTFTNKCGSTTPINHLFGPDGILLGVTFPKTTGELTDFHNASNYMNGKGNCDAKPSCTIS